MNDTCGPTSGTPLAQYDRATQSWKTSEATSLWALTLSSLTLPTWGGLHAGVLYELPTPERPTIERVYSYLLATPTAWLGLRPAHAAGDAQRWHNPERSNELSDQIAAMLPTPTAQAAKHMTMDDRGVGTHDDHNLWSVASRLLPTPAVNDMGAGKDPQAWDEWTERMKQAHGNGNGHGKSLEQEALRVGVNTPPPLTAGSALLGDLHQPPLFAGTSETA